MAIFQLSFVCEPPTESVFHALLSKDETARKLINLFNVGGRDAAMDSKISRTFGFLRLALKSYENIPRGNEAYLSMRKNALKDAMKQCDELSRALSQKIALNGLLGEKARQQYGNLASIVLDTHTACQGKFAQLNDLQRYISDKNLTELGRLWRPPPSAAGEELRSITKAHLGEYLSGFGVYVHDSSFARDKHDAWQDLVNNAHHAAAEGNPISVPCYPVYLEGEFIAAFGDTNKLHSDDFQTVDYNAGEKKSPFYMEVVDGYVYGTEVKDGAVLVTTRLTTSDKIGENVFIVDAKKNLYVYEHETGVRHHSSATAGRAVLGAGKVLVADGKITAVNDHSGHYRPTPRHMALAVRVMHEKGILAPGATLETIDFVVDIEKFVQAGNMGFDMENLADAINNQITKTYVQGLYDALTDPAWESRLSKEAELIGSPNTARMLLQRPRQEIKVTRFDGPSLVRRTRQRANALPPVQFLHPVLPEPEPQATPAPAAMPSVRNRRGGVFGRS